jgi:hypothetical protein
MLTDINFFNSSKINIHDPYEVNENLLKIDLSQDKLKPIMLVLKDLQVLSFTNDMIILSLKSKENIKKVFDDLDSHIVSVIQEKKITKKLKTKFNYRQMTSTYTNKDTQCDILTLNVNLNSDSYRTEIFQKASKKISNDEAMHTMKDNTKVDLILEVISVVFNKQEGFIYLENVVRQMKVKKIKPKRIEKLQYSFVDTDSDNSISSESEKDSNSVNTNDDDCLINTHKVETDDEDDIDIHLDSETSQNSDSI